MLLTLKLLFAWGMWLLIPFCWYTIYRIFVSKKRKGRILWITLSLLSIIGIRARFVEPQSLVVHYHDISIGVEQRIALVSDLHVGMFVQKDFTQRIVDKLNSLDVDMVLFAGDRSYEPRPGDLRYLLAPLQELEHPSYAVLGNHDVGVPGPPLREELVQVLQEYDIQLIDNSIHILSNESSSETIERALVGLGPFLAQEDEVEILTTLDIVGPVVVLTHNPDTADRIPVDSVDLILAGHTHGGQIRIPYIYRYFIPTQGDYDQGLIDHPHAPLFITSGVGTSILPLRLGILPVIDVIDL